VDDYEAIRQLTARYNRASDEGDRTAWLDCFTPTGSFRRSNDTRSFAGQRELPELAGRVPVSARHVTTDFIIDVDGDTARQTCYLIFYDRHHDFRIAMFGTYHDELVKAGGQWRFESRRLEVDLGPSEVTPEQAGAPWSAHDQGDVQPDGAGPDGGKTA
jgi:SnoaL-like domain